jgi:hypothetical protein
MSFNSQQLASPTLLNVRIPEGFEREIKSKIGPDPHYAQPIRNIGGLRISNVCRIPGIQALAQPFIVGLRGERCREQCLTNHCFEYGNVRFPPSCECGQKYSCHGKYYPSFACARDNHNSNVIFF